MLKCVFNFKKEVDQRRRKLMLHAPMEQKLRKGVLLNHSGEDKNVEWKNRKI